MSDLRVELITGAELADFSREWRGLTDRVPGTHPFRDPAFIAAAASMADDIVSLACFAVRTRSGELVAVLPAGLELQQVGPVTIPTIRSASPGRLDLTEFSVDPAFASQATAALSAELGRRCRRGTAVDIRTMLADDPLLAAASPPFTAGSSYPLRVAMLAGRRSWMEVVSGGHRRREAQRVIRRLEELASSPRWADGPEAARDAAIRFAMLHTRQQSARGRRIYFGDDRRSAILARLLSAWHGSGRADIALLTVDGRDVAGYILLHCGTATWAYRTAFDLEWSRYSPGIVMLTSALDRALSRGSERFEFSWGDQPYKEAWSEVGGHVRHLHASAGGPRGLAFRAAGRFLDRFRRSRPASPVGSGRPDPASLLLDGLLPE